MQSCVYLFVCTHVTHMLVQTGANIGQVMYKHTSTHACRHARTHTYARMHAHSSSSTHAPKAAQTHAHAHSSTHLPTAARTLTRSYAHMHRQQLALAHRTCTNAQIHEHALLCSHMHTQTHTHACTCTPVSSTGSHALHFAVLLLSHSHAT